MLHDFCLRLALGLLACLLLLSPVQSARPAPGTRPLVSANFFRTMFLVALGFCVGATLWMWPDIPPALLACLVAASVLALAGSVTWSLERSPGGVSLIVASLGVLIAACYLRGPDSLAGGLSAALLLGAATGSMLLGHNYLITPTMSMTPLFRLLAALAVALALRAGLDGFALLRWTSGHSMASLKGDLALWLPVRWAVGIVAPAVLCWMAWQTARIRSTQSATGILYVVVIFCFLGELTAQLLRRDGLTF
jgi:hypothetical protein